jgi:hypothetical protein
MECYLCNYIYTNGGAAVAQLVEAKNQKVAGSIPDGVIEFFIDIILPLTEMSTKNISWG